MQLKTIVMGTNFIVMSDVANPFVGENGATYIYGPQKGATIEQQCELERGMRHFAERVKVKLGIDIAVLPGAGAAGGLAGGLAVFLNAKMQSGIETIIGLLDLEKCIANANMVVTGEGRIDGQSINGKAVSGVGKLCSKHHVPCYAIVGGMGEGAHGLYDHGISSIVPIPDRPMELQEAIDHAPELLFHAAERLFRTIKAGIDMR